MERGKRINPEKRTQIINLLTNSTLSFKLIAKRVGVNEDTASRVNDEEGKIRTSAGRKKWWVAGKLHEESDF